MVRLVIKLESQFVVALLVGLKSSFLMELAVMQNIEECSDTIIPKNQCSFALLLASGCASRSNGNVGINNSSPQSKLDVNGDVRIATGNALLSSSSGGTVQIQGGATYPVAISCLAEEVVITTSDFAQLERHKRQPSGCVSTAREMLALASPV